MEGSATNLLLSPENSETLVGGITVGGGGLSCGFGRALIPTMRIGIATNPITGEGNRAEKAFRSASLHFCAQPVWPRHAYAGSLSVLNKSRPRPACDLELAPAVPPPSSPAASARHASSIPRTTARINSASSCGSSPWVVPFLLRASARSNRSPVQYRLQNVANWIATWGCRDTLRVKITAKADCTFSEFSWQQCAVNRISSDFNKDGACRVALRGRRGFPF